MKSRKIKGPLVAKISHKLVQYILLDIIDDVIVLQEKFPDGAT